MKNTTRWFLDVGIWPQSCWILILELNFNLETNAAKLAQQDIYLPLCFSLLNKVKLDQGIRLSRTYQYRYLENYDIRVIYVHHWRTYCDINLKIFEIKRLNKIIFQLVLSRQQNECAVGILSLKMNGLAT